MQLIRKMIEENVDPRGLCEHLGLGRRIKSFFLVLYSNVL